MDLTGVTRFDSGPLRVSSAYTDSHATQLRRIVFTHITPQTDSLTLHTLLSTPLPPDSASKHKQAYASACQVILETCGLRYGHAHYPEDSQWETVVVDKVASAFVTISGLLSETKCVRIYLSIQRQLC